VKPCAPAGCLVCLYPAATAHDRYGPIHDRCLAASTDILPWLELLRTGPLDGCLVCRSSSIWHHPQHGALHPGCVRRAMGLLDDGGTEPAPMAVAAPATQLRRGAYARRVVVVG
jgi:hypothetical protein